MFHQLFITDEPYTGALGNTIRYAVCNCGFNDYIDQVQDHIKKENEELHHFNKLKTLQEIFNKHVTNDIKLYNQPNVQVTPQLLKVWAEQEAKRLVMKFEEVIKENSNDK